MNPEYINPMGAHIIGPGKNFRTRRGTFSFLFPGGAIVIACWVASPRAWGATLKAITSLN